jgi:C4-dicarboxylate transporter, DctQ subunit
LESGRKSWFWRGFDKIVDAMAALAGVLMVFITAAVCREVVMRYFLGSPSIWVIQTCEYALLWIVFLATTWLLRERGHVTVDVLHSRLPPRSQAALDLVTHSVAAAACAVVVVLGAQETYESIVHGVTDVRAVTVPKYLVFIIIPIGGLFLTVQFCRMVWARARVLRERQA